MPTQSERSWSRPEHRLASKNASSNGQKTLRYWQQQDFIVPSSQCRRYLHREYLVLEMGNVFLLNDRTRYAGTTSPVVDEKAFPDMKGLVDKIHEKGLRAGWYLGYSRMLCNISFRPPPVCTPNMIPHTHYSRQVSERLSFVLSLHIRPLLGGAVHLRRCPSLARVRFRLAQDRRLLGPARH